MEALVGSRTGEGIGWSRRSDWAMSSALGGDPEPVQIVRVLVDEASWHCLPLTEFMEFGDQQRRWVGDVGGIGTVVTVAERGHQHRRVVDERGCQTVLILPPAFPEP